MTQTQNGFTECLWATRSIVKDQIYTDTSAVPLTYTEHLRGVELKLSSMTAIDEHSPHHIRGRDGLNILHQRQLNLLTATKTTEVCNSVNILMILTVITGMGSLNQQREHVSYTDQVCHLWFSRLSSDNQKLICGTNHGYPGLRRGCESLSTFMQSQMAGKERNSYANPP